MRQIMQHLCQKAKVNQMQFEDKSVSYFNANTEEAVCPYCGAVQTDSWELSDNDKIECCHCEKTFYVGRDVTVTYTTHCIDEDGNIDYDDKMLEPEWNKKWGIPKKVESDA